MRRLEALQLTAKNRHRAAMIGVCPIFDDLQRTFFSGKTRSESWRREQLHAVLRLCEEREAEFTAAMAADMGKPAFEVYHSETGLTAAEARHALRHLGEWMAPASVTLPLALQPGVGRAVSEPYGVALIVGAWNYPFMLVVAPLVGALAAGNTAIIKPSELAPTTSAALAEWVPKYIDPEAVRVIEGGVEETSELLALDFDKIFFTGSPRVGRIVMAAAAENLTPVTLELGGKSPAVIDSSAKMSVAAKRILWAKCVNAGQTCVAPDYVLVHRSRKDEFVAEAKAALRSFFGDDVRASPDFARIATRPHFDRIVALMEGGTVIHGGAHDASRLFIEPTLLDISDESVPAMSEEIFGPVLPIVTYDDTDEALAAIRKRPKPLALYLFSEDRALRSRFESETSSGALIFNDAVLHFAINDLPLGGVGESGLGNYHGRYGFDCFSHCKSVVDRASWVDPPIRYAPYTKTKFKWLRRLL